MTKYTVLFILFFSYQSFAQKTVKKEILHPKIDSVVNIWVQSDTQTAKNSNEKGYVIAYSQYTALTQQGIDSECRCGISEALFLLEKNQIAYKLIGRYDFNHEVLKTLIFKKYRFKLSFEGCVAKTKTICFDRVMGAEIVKKWDKDLDILFNETEKEIVSHKNRDDKWDKFLPVYQDLHKAVEKYTYCELNKTKKFSLMGIIVIDNQGKICKIDFHDKSADTQQIINFIKISWMKLMKDYNYEDEIGKWAEMPIFLGYHEEIKCE